MDTEGFAEQRVGTTLCGKWKLEKLLGVGGMAAVYVGAHKIGRREAIKILHPEVARSKELVARFEQEAHAVNRFKHPGTVEIRDVDVTDDGAPFLVMELLDGEPLSAYAERPGGVALHEVLRLIDELLGVLVAAHGQGIIHRDIKLDNLFVLKDGRLKVLDFGIARVRAGMSSLQTRPGAMLGTVPYMAPEQIRGGDIDARVDIFAVGATMFRLIARRRVHEAPSEAMMLVKMGTMPAPSLASVAKDVPASVCNVVDRALQFERDKRYPDAATMQRDVEAARAALSASTTVASAPELPAAAARAASAPGATVAMGPPVARPAAATGTLVVPPVVPAPTPSSPAIAPPAAPSSPAIAPPAAPSSPAIAPPAYAGTSPVGYAAPVLPARRHGTDDKTWIAIVASMVLAGVVFLVVLLLIRKSGSSESDPGAQAAPTETSIHNGNPDDPPRRPPAPLPQQKKGRKHK